jgi:hypothetical protein
MLGALVAKKVLAGAFDALNRHDVQKFMAAWRDDCVFIFPGEIRESGKFQGKNAVVRLVPAFLRAVYRNQFRNARHLRPEYL